MNKFEEKEGLKVTFLNQPKLSIHEVSRKQNEKRLALVPEIENFIKTEPMFDGHEVTVEFAQKGVSSLVSIITFGEQKLVLKIPISQATVGESLFLEKWKSVGISTVNIIKEGSIGGSPYLLMDFIDSKTVSAAYENYESMVTDGVYSKMGKLLKRMHLPKTEGFGLLRKNDEGLLTPEYPDFKSWIDSPVIQERILYAQENGLITEEHGSISESVKILKDFAGDSKESSYCHFDFTANNIFATDPLTVFDPDPIVCNAIIDVGRSVIGMSSMNDSLEPSKQFKQGYSSEEDPIDERVLQASIMLIACLKFKYWSKKKYDKRIANIQNYLKRTKHFLD